MNILANLVPLLALGVAELAAPAPESKLLVYGPMGIICLWLMYREERTRTETGKEKEAMRLDFGMLREEMRSIAHQIKGLNRNLLYITATHGPDGLKEVARAQLQKEQDAGGPNNPFL